VKKRESKKIGKKLLKVQTEKQGKNKKIGKRSFVKNANLKRGEIKIWKNFVKGVDCLVKNKGEVKNRKSFLLKM